MENKNNAILIILLVIFILSTLSLGGYIIYDKTLSKKDTNNTEATNNNTNTNNDNNINDNEINININDLAPLTNTLNENWLLSFMKFDSPENLLKENKKENLEYLLLELQSSEYVDYKLSDMQQIYGITSNNMKKFLKERFNYDYSDDEIKKYFENNYNVEQDVYLFTVSGGILPPEIESIYYQDEKYYISIYLGTEQKGTVVLTQENNQFYFYSSTGLN